MAKDEYEIGYGKPPKHSQFKPNESGNPKGRPKRSRDISEIWSNIFGKMITISRNGKKDKVFAVEAILLKLQERAFQGDPRATKQFLDLYDKFISANPSGYSGPVILEMQSVASTVERNPAELELLERHGYKKPDCG